MRTEGRGSKDRETRGDKRRGVGGGGWAGVNEWMGGWAGRPANVGMDGQLDREPGLASSSPRAPLRISSPFLINGFSFLSIKMSPNKMAFEDMTFINLNSKTKYVFKGLWKR